VIRFKCRRCGRVFNLHDEEAGSRQDCPGCGERLVVPEKGARARSLLWAVGIVAAVLVVLAVTCVVTFIAPKATQSPALVLVYFLVVVATGAISLHLIGRRRAERSTVADDDKLEAFIDRYPDHAASPEPESTAATCPRCRKAMESGAVVCAACGLVCPFCQSSASGLAGRETHHIECPRCGSYWIARSLYDQWLGPTGRGMLFLPWWGRIAPEDTSQADPFCERDVELLNLGWGLDKVLEFGRRGRGPT